jgi:uncharacterized protein YgiB involved in biofilm formation
MILSIYSDITINQQQISNYVPLKMVYIIGHLLSSVGYDPKHLFEDNQQQISNYVPLKMVYIIGHLLSSVGYGRKYLFEDNHQSTTNV